MATTMDILVDYLKSCGGQVASHDIEVSVPRHGDIYYLKRHNGGTYSRQFRELRESRELQQLHGIKFTEIESGVKEKSWRITNTSSMHLVDQTAEIPFVL
jgi:hypothetical protein